MKIIGITGGSGAGKTTVLHELIKHGALAIDCDVVYHQMLKTSPELLSAIEASFPGSVRDGVLDRKKLAEVFRSPELTDKLSRVTHPFVKRRVERILQEDGYEYAAVDAIGLFESGLNELCNVTVFVTAPESVRVKRVMARDGIDETAALTRIHAQKPDSYYIERCDYVIDTANGFDPNDVTRLL